MVLAGHRDTFLRPLEHVAAGMDIQITDQIGTYHYLVDRWEVVLPEQVDSISIRSRPELALVTCYPFHFVGAAPRRFVVHAHLVSLVPDQKR
jgi:sortase A